MTITNDHTSHNDAPAAVAVALEANDQRENDYFPTVQLGASVQQCPPTEAASVVGYPLPMAEAVPEYTGESQRDLELGTIMASTRLSSSHPNFHSLGSYSQRAEFISVTFIKPSPETPLQLHLAMRPNSRDVQIALWEPSSPVLAGGESPFQPGDILYSINRKPCQGMTPAQAALMLRALHGPTTLVAHHLGGRPDWVESTVIRQHHPSPNNGSAPPSWGVALGNQAGSVVISRIQSDVGMFHHSLLNIGDKIVSINGIECGGGDWTATTVVDLLRQASPRVTVVAQTRSDTGMVVAEVNASVRPVATETITGHPATPQYTTQRNNPARICAGGAFAAALLCVVFWVSFGNSGNSQNSSSTYYGSSNYYNNWPTASPITLWSPWNDDLYDSSSWNYTDDNSWNNLSLSGTEAPSASLVESDWNSMAPSQSPLPTNATYPPATRPPTRRI